MYLGSELSLVENQCDMLERTQPLSLYKLMAAPCTITNFGVKVVQGHVQINGSTVRGHTVLCCKKQKSSMWLNLCPNTTHKLCHLTNALVANQIRARAHSWWIILSCENRLFLHHLPLNLWDKSDGCCDESPASSHQHSLLLCFNAGGCFWPQYFTALDHHVLTEHVRMMKLKQQQLPVVYVLYHPYHTILCACVVTLTLSVAHALMHSDPLAGSV